MSSLQTPPVQTADLHATGLIDLIAVKRGHGARATWELSTHPGRTVLAVYPANGAAGAPMEGFDAIQRYRRERIETQRERHQ